MDCYSVHISKEFLDWYREAHPNLICLYIPATFTAWLQPLDISFNFVLSTIMATNAAMWLATYVAAVAAQMKEARTHNKPMSGSP